MFFLKDFLRFVKRLKHPVSQPEDVGKDLGIQILYNELSFEDCLSKLTDFEHTPQNLSRFMDRKQAEHFFKLAIRKESFTCCSLFSYYLYDGWLAFELTYDDQNRLRRLFVQHPALTQNRDKALEIPLKKQLSGPSII